VTGGSPAVRAPRYRIARKRCEVPDGPTAAGALQQLDHSEEPQPQPVHGWDLTADTVDTLAELDEEFAGFVANQYSQRWGSELSPRERALARSAVDVLNQTPDESFSIHSVVSKHLGQRRLNTEPIRRGGCNE
jgi:hypothetical protein